MAARAGEGKVLHAVEYVPFGFLCSRLSRGSLRRRLVLARASGCAFGLGDEIHQASCPAATPASGTGSPTPQADFWGGRRNLAVPGSTAAPVIPTARRRRLKSGPPRDDP